MSKIEVDAIDKQSGSTLTLGGSGTAVTLGAGATQSGFGRTGTVDWQTGSIKTATFTPVNGEGYFINSGSAITANLPAGSAGAIVAFSDYARNFATYNFTISPDGSEKIGGVAADLTLNVNGQAITLIYVDSTKGWVNVQNAEDTETGVVPAFVAACGGTTTTSPCGDYKIHTFTGGGPLNVTSAGNAAGSNTVEYVVVAGGASGGSGYYGGGGGAGGFRFASSSISPLTYPAKPLAGSNLPVSVQNYTIVVGAGAAGRGPTMCLQGSTGGVSTFSTITSAGGGGGGSWGNSGIPATPGIAGGSGGGAGSINSTSGGPGGRVAGAGNTPPVGPAQGEPGGTGGFNVPSGPSGTASSAGGGGAMQAGQNHNPGPGAGGYGGEGAGLPVAFGSNGVPCGSFRYYAGGGGGAGDDGTTNIGGKGGGANGGRYDSPLVDPGDGTPNSGGGGGGAIDNSGPASVSGNGGSGIVIIRYKFQ
jgi:hypothetical protein